MELKDKRIILTGAGSGIGRELTFQLLSKGAFVVALDINEEELKITKELSNNNEKLDIYKVDISSDESISNFKEEYFKKYSEVDGLINNAGIIQPFVKFNELEKEIIERVMNINFYGPLKLTKIFLPEIMKSNEAYIVNISSMGGFFPFPGQTVYCASKAALKLFTEGLYAEFLNTNVHVMVVFPGAIATNIIKNSNVSSSSAETESKLKPLSASKAASLIIKGIEKNKLQLYIGNDSKFMNLLYKFNSKKAIIFIKKQMKM